MSLISVIESVFTASSVCHVIFRNHNNMLNVENINIFVETVIRVIFKDSQMNGNFKRTAFS